MNLSAVWESPEYFYRPRRILQRLVFKPHGLATVRLANGMELTVDTGDIIGRSIATRGIYELEVTECITRLLGPGELGVDVGANIGYMTAIMIGCVGSSGRVVSFEPNPFLHQTLSSNAERCGANVEVVKCAVSSEAGPRVLYLPKGWNGNCGLGTLEADGPKLDEFEVTAIRLDDRFPLEKIGLLKLDIEGHELEALNGAHQLLRSGRVRDIVFEEHKTPSAVISLLESVGYTLFRLDSRLTRPLLLSASSPNTRPNSPPSFLATTDPARAVSLYIPGGWKCLRG